MEGESCRPESVRLLGLSEQLLRHRNLAGCRKYALQAQQSRPCLSGVDQILAIADVLIASEKNRVGDHRLDLYEILQVEPRCEDRDLMRSHFKRLLLLLNPSSNKFAFADEAFNQVCHAWSVLSNPTRKAQYDAETEQKHAHSEKESPKRSPRKEEVTASAGGGGSSSGTFWTVCPYCYYVYEYDRVYEECCLRCQNCRRAFHGVAIASPPLAVPGREAYYCCLGIFRLGFTAPESGGERTVPASSPCSSMFPSGQTEAEGKTGGLGANVDDEDSGVDVSDESEHEMGRRNEGRDSLNVNSDKVETEEGNGGSQSMHGHEKTDQHGSASGPVMQDGQGTAVPSATKPMRNRKTVARNTKKIMGRGIKGKKHGITAASRAGRLDLKGAAGTEDGKPVIGKDGGMEEEDSVYEGSEFFEGDDNRFVSVPDGF